MKSKKDKTSQQHSDVEDDDEAVKLHFQELDKELKKKHHQDGDKITRLLPLTYPFQRSEMLSVSAATRVATVLKKYECFNRPIYVSSSSCVQCISHYLPYIIQLVQKL